VRVIFLAFLFYTTATPQLLSQQVRKDKTGNVEIIGSWGEILEYHLLDLSGNFRSGNHVAKRLYRYDSLGFLVSERYVKSNGYPYQYNSGIAAITYTWNQNRDVLVIQNFDSTGSRTIDKEIGASISSYKYNSMQKVKEVSFFDKDSVRVNNNEKYSRAEFFYEPSTIEKRYDSNEKLLLVLNDTIKYLRGLHLNSSTIPKWLRKAKWHNLVDGIDFKSFAYSFKLSNQDFDGQVQMSVVLVNGNVKEIEILKVENVSKKLVDKTKRAMAHAYFIHLTMGTFKTVNGQLSFYFQTQQ
jgi:hypothetical protein